MRKEDDNSVPRARAQAIALCSGNFHYYLLLLWQKLFSSSLLVKHTAQTVQLLLLLLFFLFSLACMQTLTVVHWSDSNIDRLSNCLSVKREKELPMCHPIVEDSKREREKSQCTTAAWQGRWQLELDRQLLGKKRKEAGMAGRQAGRQAVVQKKKKKWHPKQDKTWKRRRTATAKWKQWPAMAEHCDWKHRHDWVLLLRSSAAGKKRWIDLN